MIYIIQEDLLETEKRLDTVMTELEERQSASR